MKKSLLFLSAVAISLMSTVANAGLFGGDPCSCEVEQECYGCAANKPEVLVKLTPCAYKDKPFNYYTWTKTAEKVVASGRYDWSAEVE